MDFGQVGCTAWFVSTGWRVHGGRCRRSCANFFLLSLRDVRSSRNGVVVMKSKTRCKYFTGLVNESCKVGVNYRKLVGGEDFGWMKMAACL
jgi:hypothetical protein